MNTNLDKEIDQLIKNTSHYDKDFQCMAVAKLSQLIHKSHQKINEPKMVEIVDSFLNQLDSDNKEVQTNAIKYFGEIISKLSVDNSRRIVDRIIQRIAKPENKHIKELGDVYTNGLMAIIREASYECGYQLKDLVNVTVDAIYETKAKSTPKTEQEATETQLNLINIAFTFISKWPKIVDAIQFDKTRLVLYLLQNIGNHKLSKRSYLCLGALAHSLRDKELQLILTENGGIIPRIKSQNNYEKKKDYYHALSACLKGKNLFLASLVPNLFKFIFDEIKNILKNEQLVEQEEGLDMISKLLDSLITSLHSLVQGFPSDFKQLQLNLSRELVTKLKELIVYSPRAYIAYITNEENQEQQQEEFETDSSYLVRTSALELVGLFSSVNHTLCETFIDCSELFQSLKEDKNEVRNASFNMFENLFIGISKEEGSNDLQDDLPGLRREISVFKEKVPPLLSQILKQLEQLLKNPKVTLPTRTGCARLLRQIPRTFLFTLSNNHQLQLVDKIYVLTLGELQKSKVLDLQVILVNAIECLARYRHLNYSLQSVRLLIPMIQSTKNQNLLRAAFTALAYHLCEGYQVMSKSSQVLQEVANLAKTYSQTPNLEQTARISINESILMLINHYHSILSENTLQVLLKIILDKLSIETNKIHLLNGLKTLPKEFKLTVTTKQILNQIVLSIAANLINNKLSAVKEGAQRSILAILLILGHQFKPHSQQLLQLSNSLIDAREFPEYLIELSYLFPQLFSNVINRLLNLQGVHPKVISDIIKNNNIKLNELVKLIQTNLTPENTIFCVDILSTVGVNADNFFKEISDSLWGSLCLRLVGLSGNQAYFQTISKFALGNISSKTKESARLALGDLSASNPNKFIPLLVNELQSVKQDDMDLTILSLQQAILKLDNKSYQIIEQNLLKLIKMIESNKISNESIINRIGQSLGKLYNINPHIAVKLLLKLSESSCENIRYLFATTLSSMDPYLFNHSLIEILIKLYSSDSLKIKGVAAKSLSHLININSLQMKKFITKQFFESLRHSAQFDEKLVITEVIGTKTTTDKGKPLRIQSYFLAEEIVAKGIFDGLNLSEFVKMALDIRNDFYDDVLLHRLDLIRLATEMNPKSLISLQNEFSEQLNPSGGTLKNYVKEEDDQNTRKVSLNIARKIYDILNNCKKQNSLILENYYQRFRSIPKFAALLTEEHE